MLVGIVSTPDTLILNACGVGSAAGIFYLCSSCLEMRLSWLIISQFC